MAHSIKFDEKLVGKITRNIRSELSDIFNRGFSEIKRLDELLDDKNISDSKKNSIRNYYVSRLLGIIETFLRNSFIILIDHDERNYKTSITVSLEDLRILRKRQDKFTNGEIVANNVSFQKFDTNRDEKTTYGILSEILETDLFRAMVDKNSNFPQIHENLVDLTNERHRVIHDLQDTIYTNDMLKESSAAIQMFIVTYADVVNVVRNKWTS